MLRGQTVNLRRRFREHLLRPRPGRGSYGLFQWAALEAVEVHAVVLCWVNGDQSAASRFEGYWLGLAQEAGFEAPDAHNWGDFRCRLIPQDSRANGQLTSSPRPCSRSPSW